MRRDLLLQLMYILLLYLNTIYSDLKPMTEHFQYSAFTFERSDSGILTLAR